MEETESEERVLRCPQCGMEMLWYVDTLLCPRCDWDTIIDLRWDREEKKRRVDK